MFWNDFLPKIWGVILQILRPMQHLFKMFCNHLVSPVVIIITSPLSRHCESIVFRQQLGDEATADEDFSGFDDNVGP